MSIDFTALLEQQRSATAWREANPGPLIWVTSLGQGGPFRAYTESQLDTLPVRPTTYHYIGRDMRSPLGRFAVSQLANPFRLRGEETRGSTLDHYRAWLIERFVPGTSQWIELLEILEASQRRNGIALGCWCAPRPCHGDIVRAAVLSMFAAGWRGPP